MSIFRLQLAACLAVLVAACGSASGLSEPDPPKDPGGDAKKSLFPCTEGGVRDAIAEGGGPHAFRCEGATTIVTEEAIVIDGDVILDGGGAIILDGGEDHVVVRVLEGAHVELHGFVITRGASETLVGGIENHGTLTLAECVVHDNTGEDVGGISNGYAGSLTLWNTSVSGNRGDYAGGVQNDGALQASHSLITANTGSVGGIGNYGVATVTHTEVRENRGYDVGGIWNDERASVVVTDSAIERNSADAVGGLLNLGGSVTLRDSSVSENSSQLIGGIWNDQRATLLMLDSLLARNSGRTVGGLKNDELGMARLVRCMVFKNEGTQASGIDNTSGAVVLVTSAISDACHGDITSGGDNLMDATTSCGYDESAGDRVSFLPEERW